MIFPTPLKKANIGKMICGAVGSSSVFISHVLRKGRNIRAITPIILNQSAVKLSPNRPYKIAKTTRTASWVPNPQKNRHDAAAATDDANTAMLIGIRSVKWPRRALPGTDAADISRFQVRDVPFMIAIKPVPPGRDIFISFAKASHKL